jgi:hypothetical protein
MRVSTNFMPHQLDIMRDYKNWDSIHNWNRKFCFIGFDINSGTNEICIMILKELVCFNTDEILINNTYLAAVVRC